eukprot:scaffold98_cov172-Amphora_coffeaeformis.AAC.25
MWLFVLVCIYDDEEGEGLVFYGRVRSSHHDGQSFSFFSCKFPSIERADRRASRAILKINTPNLENLPQSWKSLQSTIGRRRRRIIIDAI